MSDSTVAERVWALPGALWRLRPEACGLLTALNERVWRSGDPALLELVRVRVAQLIGNPAAARARCALAGTGVEARLAALPDYPSSPLFSSAERDVVFLAEQFVIDVGGTTEAMRAELAVPVRRGRRAGAGDGGLRGRVHPAAAADRRPAA